MACYVRGWAGCPAGVLYRAAVVPLANTAMLISISGTTAKVEAVHSCCINLHERPIPGLTDEEEVRLYPRLVYAI